MEIMYVHCGRKTNISDLRSYEHYWTSIWNKAWRFIWIQQNDQLLVGL